MKLRNEYKAFNNPYNSFNAQSLFHRMEGIQKSAIYSIFSLGLLNRESDSIYSFNKEEIDRAFEINKTSYTSINTEVINFIINTLEPMPFFGTHGIKAASKLLEYKYDRNETNT
ncbi:hypothetical protein A8A01_25185 [Ewingella americana]|nr:hypothetical protein A8A01_25185 [Ewingella americana]